MADSAQDPDAPDVNSSAPADSAGAARPGSSDSGSPFWAEPKVPAADRRAIARTLALALGTWTALNGALVLALGAAGQTQISQGILLGHLMAQGLTASWTIGALLTFRASNLAFMVGTVGATPLRLLFLVLALILLVTQFEVHVASLTGSMLVTMVYGFFVEGWTFNALTKPCRHKGVAQGNAAAKSATSECAAPERPAR